MSSSARSANPMNRMQWWILPGPSLPCNSRCYNATAHHGSGQDLSNLEPSSLPQQKVTGGDPDRGELHLGVAAWGVLVSEHRQRPQDCTDQT